LENIAPFVLSVGLIIFAAHLFTAIFERTKIPDVLPLIILGIIIGPTMFNIVSVNDFGYVGPLLSAIALILMLFEGGSHLTLDVLRTTLKNCVSLAVSTFIFTFVISACTIYYVFGGGILPAFFTGAVLGSISPAVVVPIVKMLNVSEKTKSLLVVESAITDVLSIVLALGVLKAFQFGQTSLVEFIGTNLIATMAMSLLVGFGGALIWSAILEKLRKFPNTIFTSLAFTFILYGFSESLGYSGPLAILVFGLVLANSQKIPLHFIQKFGTDHLVEFTNIEKTLFSEVIFLVKTFFFIFLGISIQFGEVKILLFALILTFLIYGSRLVLTRIIVNKNTTVLDASLISMIVPKGLAAAVLAEVPMHMGFEDHYLVMFEEIRAIVYGVIFFSILLTAILIMFQERGKSTSFMKNWFSSFKLN
jgi:NhaP-type Na+/H+ or K+/H+ antiporter